MSDGFPISRLSVCRMNRSAWLSVVRLACRLSYQLAVLLTYQPGGLSAYRLTGHQTGHQTGLPDGLPGVRQTGLSTNHAANKQVYSGTCITSPASGSKWHRVVAVGTAKILFAMWF
ncbi:hypothetical protein NSB20_18815 [Bacteroides acidifaciens]|uniref:hypothetical protein n=1 Tax=Bacteroides acidifaciens TaxID=85831 RepID=UPI00214A5004|nr:hypothetical protein [Bacteroides acidifaciens]MCR2007525.1 hypothetical protein [Bacteroides acidifaciens]